jgi:uncharacterized Zn finger protein
MSDHLNVQLGPAEASSTLPEQPARMSRVMIRCAESGEAVPAGMRLDAASFQTSDLSEQTVRCPHCGHVHTWSAKDAWIEDVYY